MAQFIAYRIKKVADHGDLVFLTYGSKIVMTIIICFHGILNLVPYFMLREGTQ